MLKREETYVDYNDEQRTKTIYFNLTKAELAKIQLKENEYFIEYMQQLLEKRKIKELFLFIEELVRRSYGEKSLDGSRFIKTPELTEEFEQSPIFSNIVMELVENPDALQSFIIGVIPKDMINNPAALNAATTVKED